MPCFGTGYPQKNYSFIFATMCALLAAAAFLAILLVALLADSVAFGFLALPIIIGLVIGALYFGGCCCCNDRHSANNHNQGMFQQQDSYTYGQPPSAYNRGGHYHGHNRYPEAQVYDPNYPNQQPTGDVVYPSPGAAFCDPSKAPPPINRGFRQ